jgi:hypothetical protein
MCNLNYAELEWTSAFVRPFLGMKSKTTFAPAYPYNSSFGSLSAKTRQSAPPNKPAPTSNTQLRREFLQKDRPSLVPQQAVIDVCDFQSRPRNVLIMFQNVKP